MPFDYTSSTDARSSLTGDRLQRIATAGIGTIDRRLEELGKECPVERVMRRASAALGIVGVTLAVLVSTWWLLVPAVAGLVLAQQHCLHCSLLSPVFCRYGLRAAAEIDRERLSLNALRVRFHAVPVTA